MFNENKRLILLVVSYATDWFILKAESDYLHRSGAVILQSSFIASSQSPSLPIIAFRSGPSPTLKVQLFGAQTVRLFSRTLRWSSSDCTIVVTVVPKKRPEIKYFQMPLVWATKPRFIKVSSEISSIKNSENQTIFRVLWKLCEPSVSVLRTARSVRTVFRTILTENFYCLPTQHSLNNLGCISNLMHKILIYLHIIYLLKSSTCFEHYPAHLQEVYVVIAYMKPLVSSLSAGDCPVHRLRDMHGQPIVTIRWMSNKPPSLSLINNTCVFIQLVTFTHTLHVSAGNEAILRHVDAKTLQGKMQ
jgi:hypothetical protein